MHFITKKHLRGMLEGTIAFDFHVHSSDPPSPADATWDPHEGSPSVGSSIGDPQGHP